MASKKLNLYISIISILGLIIFGITLSIWNVNNLQWHTFILFLILTTAAESLTVPLPRQTSISVSFATILASLLLLQPAEVILITVFGYLFSFGKERNYLKYIFNAAQLTISSGAASLAFYYMGSPDLQSVNLNIIIVVILSSFLYFIPNTLLVTTVISIAQDEKPYPFFMANMKWAVPSFLCMAPLGFLTALIYLYVGAWGLILFFLPLLLARHSFKSYMDMRQSFLDTIQSLTTVIDAKDSYTIGHSARVADYSVAVARELGYRDDQLEKIRHIALLHDAGKIAIKEGILNKPATLSKWEFKEMERHAAVGAEIVKNVKVLEGGCEIIKHHHEHFDGSGYPDGLSADKIPEGSRIIAVADTFDAMTSSRPYRDALTPEMALKELKRCSGTQFDPRMVDAFIKASPSIQLTKEEPDVVGVLAELAAALEEVNLTRAKGIKPV
ncbi:MAG: hypothetical protein CVU88_00320 [Firmicutes bacterium HGW-Firmicutes-13]|nr:MAG: hypothetical protein CVU88_00320 [Firmicutes bacterium HGW-Firmicutes-13]